MVSAVLVLLGWFWPASFAGFYHLTVLFVIYLMFLRLRELKRPFAMSVSLLGGGMVMIPSIRGGDFIHTFWLAVVWLAVLEFIKSMVHQRWLMDVRHRYSVSRLTREGHELSDRLHRMRPHSDGMEEEIELYQAVYDLAPRQKVGMSREEILTSVADALRELARRRRLNIRSTYISMAAGEGYDLMRTKEPSPVPPAFQKLHGDVFPAGSPPCEESGPRVFVDRNNLALPIRYHSEIIGCLFLSLSEDSNLPSESSMDIKLMAIIADLLGLAIQNGVLYEKVNRMAITDRLTGLFVPWYFKSRLAEEVARAFRTHRPLTVLMMDLDHFKKINDTYGHLSGDAVLKEAALRVKRTLREGDFIGRYGGEEFVAILPDTPAARGQMAAERILAAFARSPMPAEGRVIPVTLSIGIHELSAREVSKEAAPPAPAKDIALCATELVKGADEALYEAKRGGRNCARVRGMPISGGGTPHVAS